MENILITSGWLRSSYAAMRNLANYGFQIYIADTFRVGMSQFSIKKSGFDLYTSHYESEDRFVKCIIEICKKRKIDLILGSHDEVEVLSKYSNLLPAGVDRLLPNHQHCQIFNNKALAYGLAERAGLPVPKRLTYNLINLYDKLLENNMERTVIKLLKGNSSKGVFYANDPEGTVELVKNLIDNYNLTEDRYPQVEEYVNGEGWGVSVFYSEGKNIASFTHKRLREKIASGGTSTLRMQADNEIVENAAVSLFNSIGWHGFAMCEFKVCPTTGRFWFIEVNPRLWGSLPLSISAGVEFPYLGVLSAFEGSDRASRAFKTQKVRKGWTSRWILGDLLVLFAALIRRDFKTIKMIIFDGKANAVDDFHLDDPFVFLGQIIRYTLTAIKFKSFNAVKEGMVG